MISWNFVNELHHVIFVINIKLYKDAYAYPVHHRKYLEVGKSLFFRRSFVDHTEINESVMTYVLPQFHLFIPRNFYQLLEISHVQCVLMWIWPKRSQPYICFIKYFGKSELLVQHNEWYFLSIFPSTKKVFNFLYCPVSTTTFFYHFYVFILRDI